MLLKGEQQKDAVNSNLENSERAFCISEYAFNHTCICSFFHIIQPLTHVDGTHVSMEDFVFQILLPIVSLAPVQPATEEQDVNLVRYHFCYIFCSYLFVLFLFVLLLFFLKSIFLFRSLET